jgi:hypothetical protein
VKVYVTFALLLADWRVDEKLWWGSQESLGDPGEELFASAIYCKHMGTLSDTGGATYCRTETRSKHNKKSVSKLFLLRGFIASVRNIGIYSPMPVRLVTHKFTSRKRWLEKSSCSIKYFNMNTSI